MAYLKEDIIDEIKERSDIVQIISEYVSLKSAGSNYKANCPFHSEKTPSFVVSQEKQMYKCFGCGEGGDVIKFIMSIENVDFSEALRILAQKAGINLDEYSDGNEKTQLNEKHKLIQINTEAAKYFFKVLWKQSGFILDYLKKRDLDSKTIKSFGIGYAQRSWSDLTDYLKAKGYSEQDIVNAGLAVKRKKGDGYRDRFINRVMFPIFDHKGEVIGFGGRVIDDSIPKYLNSPETLVFNKRYNLYGLNFAKKNMNLKKVPVIVVEGYMDVIALHQFGIKNAVASLGTSLTKEQAGLLKRFTDEVVISYDNDSAGMNAAIRGMEVLKDTGLKVRVLTLHESNDPDEYVRKRGPEAFKREVENAVSFVQFKIDVLRANSNMSSQEGKVEFCREVAKIIKNVDSPVEAEYHIKKVSDETGISVQAIGKEVYGKYYSKRQFGNANKKEEVEQVKDGVGIAQKRLISIMVAKSEFKNEIISKLSADDFDGDLGLMFGKLEAGTEIDESEAELVLGQGSDSATSKEVAELVSTVKKNALKRKSEELKVIQKLLQSKMEKNHDVQTERKLLETGIEILSIENELRKY